VAQNATSDVQKTLHQMWPETPYQMWREEPRSNKKTEIYNLNNVNVNADKEREGESEGEEGKTDLRKLPNLDQGKERTEVIANDILRQLGDRKSFPFYYLVAAKIPENVIRRKLSELKQGSACSPAKVFVSAMKDYAAEMLQKQQVSTIFSQKQNLFALSRG
jgi:hypothetical protein